MINGWKATAWDSAWMVCYSFSIKRIKIKRLDSLTYMYMIYDTHCLLLHVLLFHFCFLWILVTIINLTGPIHYFLSTFRAWKAPPVLSFAGRIACYKSPCEWRIYGVARHAARVHRVQKVSPKNIVLPWENDNDQGYWSLIVCNHCFSIFGS